MADVHLEHELRALAPDVAFPPTPDLARAVSARLRGTERPRERWRPWLTLGLAAALLLALLVAGAASADRLGLRGIEIFHIAARRIETKIGNALRLGEPLTLEDARRRVPFTVVLPSALPPPDEVYLSDPPPGGQIALVYARGSKPLLLTEFRGNLEPAFFAKGLPPGTHLEQLSVGGGRAYWIAGEPHFFFYRGTNGEVNEEDVRMAGDVLLWERGDLTLRLEGAQSKEDAVKIAESVR